MIRRNITLPQLGLIAGTRGMLGAGIGLLLAEKLAPEQRRALGWTLLAVGALTTIPLVVDLLHGQGVPSQKDPPKDAESQNNAAPQELETAGSL